MRCPSKYCQTLRPCASRDVELVLLNPGHLDRAEHRLQGKTLWLVWDVVDTRQLVWILNRVSHCEECGLDVGVGEARLETAGE